MTAIIRARQVPMVPWGAIEFLGSSVDFVETTYTRTDRT